MVVLWCSINLLFARYVRLRILSKVDNRVVACWDIAAHSAYDMLSSIST